MTKRLVNKRCPICGHVTTMEFSGDRHSRPCGHCGEVLVVETHQRIRPVVVEEIDEPEPDEVDEL